MSIKLIASNNEAEVTNYYAERAHCIRQLASPLAAYGISHFSYGRMYTHQTCSFMTTHPEFSELYLKERLYEQSLAAEPAVYQDTCALARQIELDYFNKLTAESCRFGNLFVMIKNSSSESADFYFFGADPQNTKIEEFYSNNVDVLNNFIDYFHHAAKKTIEKLHQQRLYYVGQTRENSLLSNLPAQFQEAKTAPANGYHEPIFKLAKKYHFTPAELKYALYLRQGYCLKEMAQLTHNSTRTIEKHVDKLRKKLGARNIYHLLNQLYCG